MLVIRPPRPSELAKVQAILNHADVIAALGGFTMLDQLKAHLKLALGVWLAEWDGVPVGATLVGGRPQSHLLKYGSVGVLPEYRRRRVATALYVAMTAQGMLEGRRLFEDSIVGDNEVQFLALPHLGIRPAGELRHRTGSGKSLWLFQTSFLDAGMWDTMLDRLPGDVEIELWENRYTHELRAKNLALYAKYPLSAELPARFDRWRTGLLADGRFHCTSLCVTY